MLTTSGTLWRSESSSETIVCERVGVYLFYRDILTSIIITSIIIVCTLVHS